MVRGLFSNFFHSFGPSSSHSPASSSSPRRSRNVSPDYVTAKGSNTYSAFGYGNTPAHESAPADFSWSPLLGMKGVHISPGVCPIAGDSPINSVGSDNFEDSMPVEEASFELPSWCAAAEGSGDVHANTSLSMTANQPAQTLRRVPRFGSNEGSARDHEVDTPDLGSNTATRSVFTDPYLDPTPANRPLRQYLSAPTLPHPQADTQVPVPAPSTDVKSSSSMNDLFSQFTWPGAYDDAPSVVQPAPLATCASSSSGLGGDASANQSQAPNSTPLPAELPQGLGIVDASASQGEIDGSLYLRRVQQNHGQMPSPRPIHTATPAQAPGASALQTQEEHQQPTQQESNWFSPTDQRAVASPDSLQRRRLDEQRACRQRLVNHGFETNRVQPAQQHAGQEVSEETAQRIQAALLYAADCPDERCILGGMDAFDGRGNLKPGQYSSASPYLHSMFPFDAPHAPNFVYSSSPAVSAAPMGQYAAYSPQYHPGNAQHQHVPNAFGQMAATRQNQMRHQSMTSVPLRQPVQSATSASYGNIFEMEGLPAFHAGQSSVGPPNTAVPMQYGHGRPLSQAGTVPLMPVSLPTPSPHATRPPSHSWSHVQGPPPQALQYHQSFSALGAPPASANSARSSSAMPRSADTVASSAPTLPQTPPSAKRRAADEPMSATAAKKSRSSPNLRSPRAANAVASAVPTAQEEDPATSAGAGSITPSPARKIASNRRAQSAKDLRGKSKNSPGSPPGTSPTQSGQSSSGAISFINYGVEDAEELCSAVAPSGSYKVPLKGYGDASAPSTPAKAAASTAAGAAAIAAHKKTTSRVPVDTTRWIMETGEDSGDEDDDEDDEGTDTGSASPTKRRRTKSGSSAASKAKGGKKANAGAQLGEAIVLTMEKK